MRHKFAGESNKVTWITTQKKFRDKKANYEGT